MILTAAALITAGCGGSNGSDSASGSASSSQPSTVSPSDMSNDQAPPARLVVDVTIKDGKATPTNEQLTIPGYEKTWYDLKSKQTTGV